MESSINPLNPLNIPAVLSKVLEYITSVEDVENVRKVSTDFYAKSLGQWRKTRRLVLNGLPDGHPGILTRDFLEFLRDSHSEKYVDHHQIISKPFRDFSIRNEPSLCFSQSGTDLNHLNCLFWNKLGEHMSTLQLVNSCYLPTHNFPSALQWILLKSCQNLKELHINSPRKIYGGPSNIPVVLEIDNFLRSTAPHLTVLSLTNFHTDHFSKEFQKNVEIGKNLFNMMPHLSSLKLDASTQILIAALPHSLPSSGTFIQLESLDLDVTDLFTRDLMTFHDPYFPYLSAFFYLIHYMVSAKPPLKHLKLNYNIFEAAFKPEIMQRFFSLCANTVEKLELILNKDLHLVGIHSTPNFSELVGIDFPHLTHLSVTFRGCWKPFGPFDGGKSIYFDFRSLLNMPSLEEFFYVGGLTKKDAIELDGKYVDIRKQLEEDFTGKGEEISENPLNNLDIDESLPQQFSFTDLNVLRKWRPVIKKLKSFVVKELLKS